MDFSDQQHIDTGRTWPGSGPEIDAVQDAEMELDEERLRAIELIASLDDDGSFAASLERLRAKIPAIIDEALAEMQEVCQPPTLQNNPWDSNPHQWRPFKPTTTVPVPGRRRNSAMIYYKRQRSLESYRIVFDPSFDPTELTSEDSYDVICGSYLIAAQWRRVEGTQQFCIETSVAPESRMRHHLLRGPLDIRPKSIVGLGGPSSSAVPNGEPKIWMGASRPMEHST